MTLALDRAGVSKGEAARRLGIPRPRVAEWCRGKWMPSAARLLWIVATLRLDPAIVAPEWTGLPDR